ncbi:cytochrome P450 52A1 [Apiospora rasikravindrae]|uniref:Cytochrome P450 52A1 n=1 Tax=Apiospora rasikravindrae TaxID=990691 RepID=A0ABR1TA79_9PEZI
MLGQVQLDSVHVLGFVGVFTILYLFYFIIQTTRNELRIRSKGVRAPVLAQNPWTGVADVRMDLHEFPALTYTPLMSQPTGLRWFVGAARAQLNHRLFEFFDDMFAAARGAPTGDDCVEVQVTRAGGQRYIITRDPEHVKAILAGQFAHFGKGKEFHDMWSPFLGDSIFTTDGALWHDSRGMIRPMFVKDRVSDLVVFERWTAAMIRQIESQRRGFAEYGAEKHSSGGGDGDGVVDIQSLFYRMTLDVTTDFLLGASVDSLSNPRDEFAEAFNEVQRLQMYLTMLGPFSSIVPRARYKAGIRAIDRFVMPYIEAALALPAAELEKRTSASSAEFTFLHSVARHTRDPKVLRDQIVAVLLAGRDTTAATLSWAVYQLSRYPAKVARLRAEILDTVGPAPNAPSYETLKNMPYLRHVLNETLRLYPAVPYNLRIALEDTAIPSKDGQGPPIAVLKNDVVVYSTLSMQRRHNLYPQSRDGGHFADPALFEPERWEHWTPKPWTYVPFNGGPRICVGQNFALTEMGYVVVRLLQKYEKIEYVGDWDAQFHEPEVVGRPGQEVKVRLHEAANAS